MKELSRKRKVAHRSATIAVLQRGGRRQEARQGATIPVHRDGGASRGFPTLSLHRCSLLSSWSRGGNLQVAGQRAGDEVQSKWTELPVPSAVTALVLHSGVW